MNCSPANPQRRWRASRPSGNHGERGQENVTTLVGNIEREADELRRILIEELDKNSWTPLDREDIFALSRAIDDVVDYANPRSDEMEIYE